MDSGWLGLKYLNFSSGFCFKETPPPPPPQIHVHYLNAFIETFVCLQSDIGLLIITRCKEQLHCDAQELGEISNSPVDQPRFLKLYSSLDKMI